MRVLTPFSDNEGMFQEKKAEDTFFGFDSASPGNNFMCSFGQLMFLKNTRKADCRICILATFMLCSIRKYVFYDLKMAAQFVICLFSNKRRIMVVSD